MKVLISGASIAGPALAYWLSRSGHEVTVVEQATSLRPGGQAVDFKGATHRVVLERMGLWQAIGERRAEPVDAHFIDAEGRLRAVMPHEFTGGDVEIGRGDLARLLFERTTDDVEYVFGDRIETMHERPDAVEVAFSGGRSSEFDLVVGADGVHSAVRRLAFGPEEEYVKFLGYYYAVAGGGASGSRALGGRDDLFANPAEMEAAGVRPGEAPSVERPAAPWYNEPGRLVVVGGSKAPALLVFASPPLEYDRRDVAQQKRIVADAYANAGWRVPEVLDRVAAADDFSFDGLNRVHMDRFTRGRIALVGDAGYANTLGGFGTGLAIVGAFVLAGELAEADGDHRIAFAGYDERMRRYSKVARSGNAGPFLAPTSRLRIAMRNATFRNRLLFAGMMKLTDAFATDIDLPAYPKLALAGRGGARRS